MYARRNWLGYLAIGLGLAALIISISGRMDSPRGSIQPVAGYGRRNGPAAAAQGAQPQAAPQSAAPAAPHAAPVAPNTPQEQVTPGFGTGRSFAGRRPTGDARRSPLGGLIPLVGGLLVMGLGLTLFVGSGRRGRRGGQQGGPGAGQPIGGEQDRQQVAAVYPAAAPQPQPAAPVVAPAPPQTPPASPQTGETTRLYDF